MNAPKHLALAVGCGLVALASMVASAQQAGMRPAAPTAATRGEMLYENHCTICHTSVVHVREDHRATSDVAVEGWVRKWSSDQKLGWTDQDVMEVTDFLLRRYYGFQ